MVWSVYIWRILMNQEKVHLVSRHMHISMQFITIIKIRNSFTTFQNFLSSFPSGPWLLSITNDYSHVSKRLKDWAFMLDRDTFELIYMVWGRAHLSPVCLWTSSCHITVQDYSFFKATQHDYQKSIYYKHEDLFLGSQFHFIDYEIWLYANTIQLN